MLFFSDICLPLKHQAYAFNYHFFYSYAYYLYTLVPYGIPYLVRHIFCVKGSFEYHSVLTWTPLTYSKKYNLSVSFYVAAELNLCLFSQPNTYKLVLTYLPQHVLYYKSLLFSLFVYISYTHYYAGHLIQRRNLLITLNCYYILFVYIYLLCLICTYD